VVDTDRPNDMKITAEVDSRLVNTESRQKYDLKLSEKDVVDSLAKFLGCIKCEDCNRKKIPTKFYDKESHRDDRDDVLDYSTPEDISEYYDEQGGITTRVFGGSDYCYSYMTMSHSNDGTTITPRSPRRRQVIAAADTQQTDEDIVTQSVSSESIPCLKLSIQEIGFKAKQVAKWNRGFTEWFTCTLKGKHFNKCRKGGNVLRHMRDSQGEFKGFAIALLKKQADREWITMNLKCKKSILASYAKCTMLLSLHQSVNPEGCDKFLCHDGNLMKLATNVFFPSIAYEEGTEIQISISVKDWTRNIW